MPIEKDTEFSDLDLSQMIVCMTVYVGFHGLLALFKEKISSKLFCVKSIVSAFLLYISLLEIFFANPLVLLCPF